MTTITIPDFYLVVLIGASSSGKSTFAQQPVRCQYTDLAPNVHIFRLFLPSAIARITPKSTAAS